MPPRTAPVRTRVRGVFNRGPLDNEMLDADVSGLIRFYRDRGYLDARDRRITPSPDGREAIVTFVIDEGRSTRSATSSSGPGVRGPDAEHLAAESSA